MTDWINQITDDPADFGPFLAAYEHYDAQYEAMRVELDENRLRGQRIVAVGARVPGLSEHCYAHWAQIKAIVDLLELRVQAAVQKARKFYTESYARSLGAQQIEHYAKADQSVLAVQELLIRMRLMQEKWEGVSRGLERLHHQLRAISELRKVGMEDATI